MERMIGSRLSFIGSVMCFCFFFIFISFFKNTFVSSTSHMCRPDKKIALLNFKNESQILNCQDRWCFLRYSRHNFSKTKSWMNNSDCCLWDGVTCDVKSGVVIGLDLSHLHGNFKPNSSLFRLNHLQSLNLAHNNFFESIIPSDLGKLTELTLLNLSGSRISGRIPNELLHLTNLVSLDLSLNFHLFTETSFLSTLAKNLTNLRDLRLQWMNLSSVVLPQNFANMSSLRTLNLDLCNFLGEFPIGVFSLPHIESISLYDNMLLRGSLPDFSINSSLRLLDLTFTDFSGSLPNSIRNLKSLESLTLSATNFSGNLPNSIGNLTSLKKLDLLGSNLDGEIPSSIVNLNQLNELQLSYNKFTGIFPLGLLLNLSELRVIDLSYNRLIVLLPSAGNGTNKSNGPIRSSTSNYSSHLEYLGLSECMITEIPGFLRTQRELNFLSLSGNKIQGQVPKWLGNLPELTDLDLSSNSLNGQVPKWLWNLPKLSNLNLSHNSLNGQVAKWLWNLLELMSLDLSHNSLNGQVPKWLWNLPELTYLDLSHNSLNGQVPKWLWNLPELMSLDLSHNSLNGQVPKWLWNLPKLRDLDLSHNSLNSFEGPPKVLSASNIQFLDLSSNEFQGPFPIPPISIERLLASANNFTGNIAPVICKLNSLKNLDLSNNSFSGLIPPCLGNLSSSLSVVDLRNNNLGGSLFVAFNSCESLRTLEVGHNKLIGKLPRSLLNCKRLQILNVESNRINDTFPLWLKDLQQLKVLVMRSNEFYGLMATAKFPNLQIMDISHNNFFGTLPSDFFANWTMMSSKDNSDSEYLNINSTYYNHSIVMTNKGTEMKYDQILSSLKVVDFSGNRFGGQIPESIGLLQGLIVLNFSNNIFIGHVPQSLANLTQLESLDLSQNRLSGEIPTELEGITFLEHINFSHNRLTGRIPQGPQFTTQDSSSFEGNPLLCGRPLEKACDVITSLAQPNQQSEPQEEVVSWIAVVVGSIFGLVFEATIGHIMTSYKQEWFLNVFSLNI